MKRTSFINTNDFWLHKLRIYQPTTTMKDKSIIIKGKSMNKELMFIISVAMPKEEAESFARSQRISDTLYIVKTVDHPERKKRSQREKYIVVRPLRPLERTRTGDTKYFNHKDLIFINRKAVA